MNGSLFAGPQYFCNQVGDLELASTRLGMLTCLTKGWHELVEFQPAYPHHFQKLPAFLASAGLAK